MLAHRLRRWPNIEHCVNVSGWMVHMRDMFIMENRDTCTYFKDDMYEWMGWNINYDTGTVKPWWRTKVA